MASTCFRAPRRISITIPFQTYQELLERSDLQGRSLSNLAAYLLESALNESDGQQLMMPRQLH